jgi:5-methylcytosine-specific restriction endonuclease McrA
MERALHPCPTPGCPGLTPSRLCADCQAERHEPYDGAWGTFSAAYLTAHPRCSGCGQRATQTDHVTPLALGGARLDLANVTALCQDCHARKTARSRPRKA